MKIIRKAELTDVRTASELASLLWPEHPIEEMEKEVAELLSRPDTALFLAQQGGKTLGYAQCQLRRDYVEGTVSSPVGYLEGIYIREAYRRQGTAKALLRACEAWARDRGCSEFASDCELTNYDSFRFHLAMGFLEANRIICFTKKLGE